MRYNPVVKRRRILLNAATMASIVLCVATVVLWVRSRNHLDRVSALNRRRGELAFLSAHGGFSVIVQRRDAFTGDAYEPHEATLWSPHISSGPEPGFGIDEVSALRFVRGMAEWNLPAYVFESAGVPGFHLRWMRPSLFAAGLWADPDSSSQRKQFESLGGQADLYFNVLHRYDMTLSAGYAVGLEGSRRKGSEWMISLKIM